MNENVVHLKRYVDREILAPANIRHYSLLGAVFIGSEAYPEFARKNSDIDLLVIIDSDALDCLPKGIIEHLGFQTWPDGQRLIECRVFTIDAFRGYLLTCDVAKSYAFVRGYKVICDRDGTVSDLIALGLNRFWTDSFALYCQLARMSIPARILNTKFHFTDARNYIIDPRIRQQPLLSTLRTAEILKDYLIQLFTLFFASKIQSERPIGFDPDHPLLRQCGFLLALAGVKGARMIDVAKYPNESVVLETIYRLDRLAAEKRGAPPVECILNEMDCIFQELFGQTLWITEEFSMNYRPFADQDSDRRNEADNCLTIP